MTQEGKSFRGNLTRRQMIAGAVAMVGAAKGWGADDPRVRIVTQGLRAPESPKPMADGSVLVVEMARGTLTRVMPNGDQKVVCDFGSAPNGCAVGPDGSVIVALSPNLTFKPQGDLLIFAPRDPNTPSKGDPSVQKVDLRTGKFTPLYTNVQGAPIPGANDLVFDRQGGFYLSGGGSVHYAKSDGKEIRKIANVMGSNGIVLSPDHKRLFVCSRMRVVAFDILGPGRLALDADGNAKATEFGKVEKGSFDSMAAEADGGLVVGTLDPGALTSFDPAGKVRESLPLASELFVTSVGFGGPNLKTAYATLTQTGKLAAVTWPRSGLKLVHQ